MMRGTLAKKNVRAKHNLFAQHQQIFLLVCALAQAQARSHLASARGARRVEKIFLVMTFGLLIVRSEARGMARNHPQQISRCVNRRKNQFNAESMEVTEGETT